MPTFRRSLLQWIEDLRRDLVYGIRTLVRTPGFTAVAITTLALGISAVTVIYSVVRNVVLDPFPYTRSERLVNVVLKDASDRIVRGPYFSAVRVSRLPGTDHGRLRGRRRDQSRLGVLGPGWRDGAARRGLDDREWFRVPGCAAAHRPHLRRQRYGAGRTARRGDGPPRVDQALCRRSRRPRPDDGAQRRGVDGRRRHAAAIRVEHRGPVAAG